MNSGDSIQAAGGLWNFSDGVATVFDKHIEKSVPGYLDSLNIVNDLADSLLPVGGSLLDIGCSTGTLCNLLLNTYKDRQLTITGIDNEIEMIDFAIKNSTSSASSSELNFVHADLGTGYINLWYPHPHSPHLIQ